MGVALSERIEAISSLGAIEISTDKGRGAVCFSENVEFLAINSWK